MDQIIKPDSVDFNALIKNSTTLTLNTQSKMVEILNKEFTQEESRWYIANLYIYMNYHPTNDYPINLDTLVKLVGFAHKKNAKTTLENNFIKDEDYKILLTPKGKQVFTFRGKNSKPNLGGRPNEQVMLNVDTFKNMCMLVKTDKGKQIRKYYVKLENIYNKIIKEEIENQKLLLEQEQKNNAKLIEENNQKELEYKEQLEEKQKELATLKKLKAKRWYNQEPGDTIYAIKIDDIIKIGKTKNIKKRESYYTENQTGDIFYIKKCHNCDLSEKVIHHMLDKHREENNKEWFNISNELAIYIIDIVCDFLDNFINYSEKLPISNLKEYLDSSYKVVNPCHKNDCENKEPSNNSTDILNKVVNITCNEDKMKRFIQEFCEIDENNYALSYELLGAYRIWSKGLTAKDRSLFSKFMKKNYKSRRKYYKEHNESSLLTYIGIKPKDLNITRQDKNTLPKYEEFVLTECKYNYNYRIGYTNFIDEYKKWYLKKYPDYIFSKQEHFNMDTYLNRYFLKEKINMPGYRNVLGIWGIQFKCENSVRIGINPTHRKEIVKIDYKTRTVIEEYKSLTIASDILKLDQSTIRNYIEDKRLINDSFVLQYKKDII
jgi:phage anti-repressor protein